MSANGKEPPQKTLKKCALSISKAVRGGGLYVRNRLDMVDEHSPHYSPGRARGLDRLQGSSYQVQGLSFFADVERNEGRFFGS